VSGASAGAPGTFRVIAPDGKPAKCVGGHGTPAAPGPDNFITIAPKQVLIQQDGLPYEFALPGAYQISATAIATEAEFKYYYGDEADKAAKNPDNVWIGTLSSNVVTLSVEQPATRPAAASTALPATTGSKP